MTAIARLRTSLTKSFPRLARVTNIYKRRVQLVKGALQFTQEFLIICFYVLASLFVNVITFSVLTLLDGRQEEHLPMKVLLQ